MTEKEFVEWFKGFSEGVHHYNITPKQWDYVKEKLSSVGTKEKNSYIIDKRLWTVTIA
jgi:hypothetical protein